MRSIHIINMLLLMLSSHVGPVWAECDAETHTSISFPSSNRMHAYRLIVTSASGEPVEVAGSIAFAGAPDGFESINAQTPFEFNVNAQSLLFIVKAKDTRKMVDFSLSVDGREETAGSGHAMYSGGDNIPRLGLMFTANYRVD